MSWYTSKGAQDDIVVSTRARLARNLAKHNFPSMLSASDGKMVIDEVWQALSPIADGFTAHRIDKLPQIAQQTLLEKHLISPTLTGNDFPRAVFINRDETISIMVNEEDHLRIQCILPGLDPEKTWDTANKVDDLLNEKLEYVFHEKYGYLTSCPTNTGTGLRISAMLHLPAICLSGGINSLLSQAAKSGMTVRGIYGEGSGAAGNFFQISNQVTLGLSEKELIERLVWLVKTVSEAERSFRGKLREHTPPQLADRILRAYGSMNYSYIMTSGELINLLSDVRLGIYLGIIQKVDFQKLTELMVITGPANIAGKNHMMTPEERDIKRAQIVKAAISGN